MRKINTADVFKAMRLIQGSELKQKLIPIIKNVSASDDKVNVGIAGMLSVIEVFAESKCEKMIYDWLAGPLEVDPKTIPEMDISELADNLEALGKENDLKRFFTVLSGLITKKQ